MTMPATQDQALTLDRRIRGLVERGDVTRALCQVFECYGSSVHRFCCMALADTALADDVQQQIFMEVFRDLPRFEYRSSVRSWLFSIARHRVGDAVKTRRRAQARISPSDSDELPDAPDPRPSADESIDATRLRAALHASLHDLREPVRTAVVLRYQLGYTFEQIAQVCGDTPGTHHARVTRALRRLREGIESRILSVDSDTCRRLPRGRGNLELSGEQLAGRGFDEGDRHVKR